MRRLSLLGILALGPSVVFAANVSQVYLSGLRISTIILAIVVLLLVVAILVQEEHKMVVGARGMYRISKAMIGGRAVAVKGKGGMKKKAIKKNKMLRR